MEKRLPHGAYGHISGNDYVPYVTDPNLKKTESNMVALVVGIVLATLFAASTAYSGMKSGLTVAAGIPGAIIGAAFLRAGKNNILGVNLIQGMSSGGESVASGIIFVLPALIVLGMDLSFIEGAITGLAGVLLGIGFATVVQNYLLVDEHGTLMYPESMAISETLVTSETGGEALKYLGIGAGIGAIFTLVTAPVLNKVNNFAEYLGGQAYKWRFQVEANPMLLGIGFIVGLEVALHMFMGSIFTNFVLIPLIGYFGGMADATAVVWNNPELLVKNMVAGEISNHYTRYIGAGMMLGGGFIGVIKLIPVIITSLKETFSAKSSVGGASKMQLYIIVLGVILTFGGGVFISGNLAMAVVGSLLSIFFMLIFVIVAGRLTGTIGTSNLPVSGMTIASLVIVAVTFVAFGWKSVADNKSLLLFATMIVTAIAMAGGYLQSQKVTFVMGGTKEKMQKHYIGAGVIGVIVVVAVIIVLRDQIEEGSFAIPQANLMATLTNGIMSGDLPWTLIFTGLAMSIVLHFLKLPIMSIAIGAYLPMATTSIILVGALIRVFVEKKVKDEKEREIRVGNGVGLSAGLVAGSSILGIVGAVIYSATSYTPKALTGFLASNTVVLVLLVILVACVTIPIMTFKIKE